MKKSKINLTKIAKYLHQRWDRAKGVNWKETAYVAPSRFKLWLGRTSVKARQYLLKNQDRSRLLAGSAALLILFGVGNELFQAWNLSAGYSLDPKVESILFDKRPELAQYFDTDYQNGVISFNKEYSPAAFQSGQSSQPQFMAEFKMNAEEGISVTDPVNKTGITIKPLFRLRTPVQDDNRIVYPLLGSTAIKVVTLASIGFKEDLILTEPQGDNVEFKYELDLPDGVEARLENDGSLGFYGVDSALLGDVNTGSDADAKLLENARKNGEKNILLFRSPPPYVLEQKRAISQANAWYTLDGNVLTLHAAGLNEANYPLSIDPSIYVETAAKLMRGNNETNIDFDVADELIQKGSTTGARIDDWSSTMSLNDDRWNGGTAVAGGYVYSIGGMTSDITTVVYSTSGSDTFDVPSGVTSITVKAWGAGGGGGAGGSNGAGGAGGGGGFSQATLTVTPSETLSVYVGSGGGAGSYPGTSGAGAGGGGHSEVNRSGTNLIIAAGGGGGGGGDNSSSTAGGAGGAGGGTSGTVGGASSSAGGGGAGTSGSGGSGGTGGGNNGSNGGSESGGDGANGSGSQGSDGGENNGGQADDGDGGTADTGGFAGGGGGGGGLYGGGGGSGSASGNAGGGGGGGGSGYVTGTSTTLTGGSGATPGNSSDTSRGSAGEGGTAGGTASTGSSGTDGIVIITYSTATDDTISYVRSNGSSGTSTTLDIGSAGNNRLVVVIADDESSGTNLSGATVDGNACNLVTVADNGSGAGNHQEMWYCDEGDLGSSNGSVTVAITGGDGSWAVHAHLYTGVSQGGPDDYGIDNSSVGGSTVTVNNIDVPANGLVVMGAGNGQSGTWNSWTSPLTERTDSPNPTSAVLGTASAVESSAQTNKSYVATASVGDILRGTGIVASWDHGLVGGSGNTVKKTVYWARLSTSNSQIESPNPGAGTCTDWCTDSAYDLPEARAGFSLVAYNGFLYVIGGVDSTGTRSDNVYISKLGANGEPSLWHPTDPNKSNWVYWYQSSTYDLSSARSYLSSVAYNNRMYVLGGSTSGSPGGITTVEYVDLSPTGLYSSWTSTGMTALPSARHSHSTHVYNDYMYLIGGNSSGTLQNTVYYAKLNNDGTMNAWVATSSFNTARSTWGGVYSAVWGGYFYLGGGCSAVNGSGYCTTIESDMQLASINADGSLAPWNTMTNISNERIGYGFVSWRNAIYKVGGCSNQDTSTGDCTQSLPDADYGVINPAGEVSTVSISVPSGSSPCSGGSPTNCDLPPPGDDAGEGGQMLSATTILNGFLYVIGGCIDYDCSGTNPAGDDADVSGNISYVSIGSDGTLSAPSSCSGTSYGAWCVDSTNRINGTTGVAASGITTFNNRIYVVGGLTGSGLSPNIYYNSTNSDGSLAGTWSSVDMTSIGLTTDIAYTYAYARANPASAGTNPGNLFIFGGCGTVGSGAGCGSSDYRQEVYKCNITTSGSVSGCSTSGQLQIDSTPGYGSSSDGLGIHSGTVYANYIFLVGGYSQSEGDKDDVIYAQFNNSNNVVAVSGSDWIESSNKLSIGRRRGWAFGYNGHIYAVGGYDDTGTGIIPFIEWSKMNVSDGSIDPFITSSVTINQRWGLSMAVSNSYAYVIGGCDVGSSPSGCSSFEPAVQTFQLYNNDSGTPAGYSAGANLFSTDRLGASSAVLNGYIYLAGGCISSSTDCTDATNSVQYAPLDDYGNIGSWSATTANLPADRAWGQLETAGGSLYYIGGQSDTATDERAEVYYATPSSGDVSTWNTASNGLPAARTQFGAAVWNNRIYVTGGNNTSATAQTTVYVSPQLNSGGNITSSWSTSTSFNIARNGHTTIAYANNLYVFGGYTGSNYLSDSQFTQINSDGSVDSWSYTTSLPTPLRQADGFATNGYLYLFGGRSADSTCLSRTLVTPISANTTITTGNNPTGVGEWYQTNQKYSGDRYGGAAALYEGKAYVLGGACSTGGTNKTVYSSTGADTYSVPSGVTSITIKAWGAGGGGGAGGSNGVGGNGGGAGFAQATITVTPSETLNVYVGSAGGIGTTSGNAGGGAGGGGHSEVNRSGTNLIIASGGGGGGGDNSSSTAGGVGAPGGGTNGSAGGNSSSATGGGGGTTGAGGAAGTGDTNGTAGGAESAGDGGNGGGGGSGTGGANNGGQADDGDGGSGANNYGAGGGGGGGRYGGGGGGSAVGGNAGGGGGGSGSGYVTGTGTTLTSGSGTTPGNSGDSDRSGAGNGGAGGGTGANGSAGSNGIVVISYTLTPTLNYTGSNRVVQTALLSQPQVAKYSRMIDTDTDVFPNRWLMNGVDNSIGAYWQVRYRSSTAANAEWGQETNFGDVTLGNVEDYTPLDDTGTDTEYARYFYFSVSIDASQTFGYPDDVSRGPTITDITLFFTADPGKRLRHGSTFTGGIKQPLDTPPGP